MYSSFYLTVMTGKGNVVIQALNYNLCFVDPSIRFVSIITITPFYHISTCIILTIMLTLKIDQCRTQRTDRVLKTTFPSL